ncbi:iron ABC transporter substrate-binding protein [Bacillus sp. HMF5848]|uniref:helical backbone metal receptor n=1 Tax=Bacillus sp. HMF5848 TaxID=2495421 RepID=UPI000F79C342|nr:helical backbone metal receptor [Bacillus sp. HMF5848]RSK29061.1 iron ABC transporter substrate-binding protein [Bacillus sp. HMF5848]
MKKQMVDAVGRQFSYAYPPTRIVSLVPGITETLFALGLEEQVVGRTRFCKFPIDKVEKVPAISGTKDINIDRIRALKPDLIIAEKEENTKDIVETLEKEFPVYVAEIQSVNSALDTIEQLGFILNVRDKAAQLVCSIREQFHELGKVSRKRVAYFIWRKPYMVAGRDTYINSVLTMLGYENVFTDRDSRYPAVDVKDIQLARVDYIFLASEPFPFSEKHKKELQDIVPDVPVVLVDGEMFWSGAKMLEAAKYFKNLQKTCP